MPDHVKLTGTDHQIKWDVERRVLSSDPRLAASFQKEQIFIKIFNQIYIFLEPALLDTMNNFCYLNALKWISGVLVYGITYLTLIHMIQ